MPEEQSISIYFPIIKDQNTTRISGNLIFLSKEEPDGSEYFSFDIQTFRFRKIDNLMGYLIDNNIHSLTSAASSPKIVESIRIALKKHDDPESNRAFELLTEKPDKRTMQN